MTISVKPLAKDHKEAWHPLWMGYLAYYKSTVSDQITEATWVRLLDPSSAIKGFGAFDENDKMVGIVHYLFHPVTWSKTDRCYLEDLFASPEARGKGVGRALIEAVEKEAVNAGADQLYWLTEDFNHTAHKLYDKVADKTPFIKYAKKL